MLLAHHRWIVIYLKTVSIQPPVSVVANPDVHVRLFWYLIACQKIVILWEVPVATVGLLKYAVIVWHVRAIQKIVEW